jgi:hypothetical protein
MEQIEVFSTYAIDPEDGTRFARILLDYSPAGQWRVTDITGAASEETPTDPNELAVRVTGDATLIAAIDADPNYPTAFGTRQLVGEPEDPALDTVPTQTEYTAYRRQLLDQVNTGNGRKVLNSGQFNKVWGPLPDGRTWREIHQFSRDQLSQEQHIEQSDSYIITAATLPGQSIGYGPGGGAINNDLYRELTISELSAGSGPSSGNVVFELGVAPDDPLPGGYLHSITVQGEELLTVVAEYDENRWEWSGTNVAFVAGEDYPFVITLAEPPQTSTLVPGHIEDNFFGFVATDGIGSMVDTDGFPPTIRGLAISRVASSPSANGIFILDIELGTVPLPKDFFDSMTVASVTVLVGGQEITLYTIDASFDATQQIWTWVGTGFWLIEGETYTVTVDW